MKHYNFTRQRGTTIFLSLVFMVGLFAAVAMGTDTGHWLVNKTRLQNALDATALSAAITLLGDINRSTANASAEGRLTFNTFKAAAGNGELGSVDVASLVFQFSSTLTPFNPGTAPPNFVRVSANTLTVAPIFAQVLPTFANPITITAQSTAGAVGQNCSLAPFVLCANTDPAIDNECNDDTNGDGTNDCYGYEIGGIKSLIIACNGNTSNCPPDSLESGNYNLLNLDTLQGGKDIREALEDPLGRNICAGPGNVLNTKPGYTWGNVKQGINNRFDSDDYTFEYTAQNGYLESPAPPVSPSAYETYKNSGLGSGRRELAVPIGNCTGLQNGNSNLPLVGIACVFLTEKAVQGPGPIKKIMTEFTGQACQQAGSFSPTNGTLNGPYKVVIFKTEGSSDS